MADAIESNAASSGQLSLFPDEAPTVRDGQGGADEQQQPWLKTRRAGGTRRPWTGSTPPCCSKPPVARRRSGTSSAPNRTGGPTSSGCRTPCPPCTPGAARRSACWTGCSWLHPDNFFPPEVKRCQPKRSCWSASPCARMFYGGKPIIRDMRMAVEHIIGKLAAKRYGGHPAGTVSLPGTRGHPEPAWCSTAHRSISGERVYERVKIRQPE